MASKPSSSKNNKMLQVIIYEPGLAIFWAQLESTTVYIKYDNEQKTKSVQLPSTQPMVKNSCIQ